MPKHVLGHLLVKLRFKLNLKNMANENVNDVDSGVASSDVTPVNQESVSITPPEPSTGVVEEITTPAVAAGKEMDQLLQQAPTHNPAIEEAESDDDIDESLAERLFGLSEMFPESLRKATSTLARSSVKIIAGGYMLSRNVVWCVATTSLLLFAPVLFEVERVNAEEMIKQDRNKLVLGPGTAMSGGPNGLAPPPPTQ